jgi:small-conductance mechanosensitive channel
MSFDPGKNGIDAIIALVILGAIIFVLFRAYKQPDKIEAFVAKCTAWVCKNLKFVWIIGVLVLLKGIFMDTTAPGTDIHNIGLMQNRYLYVIIGISIIFACIYVYMKQKR